MGSPLSFTEVDDWFHHYPGLRFVGSHWDGHVLHVVSEYEYIGFYFSYILRDSLIVNWSRRSQEARLLSFPDVQLFSPGHEVEVTERFIHAFQSKCAHASVRVEHHFEGHHRATILRVYHVQEFYEVEPGVWRVNVLQFDGEGQLRQNFYFKGLRDARILW